MGTGLFQFLSFFVLDNSNGGAARWLQYSVHAAPSGVLALAGPSSPGRCTVSRWVGPSMAWRPPS
jgi:hypothetical protein